MRIGFDMDGVLANFYDAYEQKCIEADLGIDRFPRRGRQGVSIHPPCWNWPEHYGYAKAVVSAAWQSIKNDESFWAELPVMDPAGVEIARELHEDPDHDVYFVTARPGRRSKLQTETWLEAQGIAAPTVLMSDQKGYIAKALNLEVYIDDKIENCLQVRAMSPSTRCYCPDRDYNRDSVLEQHGAIRVADVTEVFEREGFGRLTDVTAA